MSPIEHSFHVGSYGVHKKRKFCRRKELISRRREISLLGQPILGYLRYVK